MVLIHYYWWYGCKVGIAGKVFHNEERILLCKMR